MDAGVSVAGVAAVVAQDVTPVLGWRAAGLSLTRLLRLLGVVGSARRSEGCRGGWGWGRVGGLTRRGIPTLCVLGGDVWHSFASS